MADDDTAALYALTPLDGRYAGRVSKIRDYFSEAALIKARVRVEVEYLASLSQVIPALGDVFEGDGLARWRAVASSFGPDDAKRVKTIDAQCLLKHDYVKACLEDGRAPFKKAKEKFLKAFASEHPLRGGCPGLPGP